MDNISINSLLNSLSKSELKKFDDFLCSPYFNKNKNVVALNMYFQTKRRSAAQITYEDMHTHVYGTVKFNRENIKTVIYLLTRLVEKFFVISSIEKDSDAYNNRLLRVLHQRDLDEHFEKLSKRLQKNISDAALQVENIYTTMDTEKLLTEFYAKKTNEEKLYGHFLKVSENLIAVFMVDMLKQYILFWRLGYVDTFNAVDYTTKFLDTMETDKVYNALKESGFPYLEFITPFYKIYKFLNNDPSETVSGLRNSIVENKFISNHEKFILSTNLVNTLYYKVLREGSKYSLDLFEAFKLLLSLYKYSGENYLRFTIYTNIIRLGVQLGEYEWTEKFINDFHGMIEPSSRESMFNYGNCYLAYAKGDFGKCLEHESKINYSNFQQRYYLRDLRLCSLYELGKFESALSLIDSYKHFVRSDKSYSTEMKQGYILFIGYIYDLVRFRLGVSRKELGSVRGKLNNSLPMRKDWLVKKFDELANTL